MQTGELTTSNISAPASHRISCVIVAYNDSHDLNDAVRACSGLVQHVIIAQPTDNPVDDPADLEIVSLPDGVDAGSRGAVVMAAAKCADEKGSSFLLTMDAGYDRTHIDALLANHKSNHETVLIGRRREYEHARPNLLIRMETGSSVRDPDCSLRLYPVKHLLRLGLNAQSSCFETEALVKAIWAGLAIESVILPAGDGPPPPPSCHGIRKWLLHILLLCRQILPFPHRKLVKTRSSIIDLIRHPHKFLTSLIGEHATPAGLSAAAALGVFLGTVPLIFCHTVAIVYVATRLNLNKVMAFAAQHICLPPFVPVLCIEVGHYLLHGRWLTEISMETTVEQLHLRLWEWFVGSLVVAPILSLLTAAIIFSVASVPSRRTGAAMRRGNRLGFWFFRTTVQLIGLRPAYALLYAVCSYYFLFDRTAVRAAKAYLTRRFPTHGQLRILGDVYKLFVSQGKSLIDRYYLTELGGNIDMTFNGGERIAGLSEKDTGFILLTSHIGNWQIAMSALSKLERPVCLLMRPEDNLAVEQSLNMRSGSLKIVSPDQFLGGVVEMMNLISEGSIVSIMGDRNYGSNAVDVTFLDHKASFPYGAFTIAAATGCPIVVLLSARTGYKKYQIDVGGVLNPEYVGNMPKREQLARWVQEYADMINGYVNQHPYQCFLFHDVWSDPDARAASTKL